MHSTSLNTILSKSRTEESWQNATNRMKNASVWGGSSTLLQFYSRAATLWSWESRSRVHQQKLSYHECIKRFSAWLAKSKDKQYFSRVQIGRSLSFGGKGGGHWSPGWTGDYLRQFWATVGNGDAALVKMSYTTRDMYYLSFGFSGVLQDFDWTSVPTRYVQSRIVSL